MRRITAGSCLGLLASLAARATPPESPAPAIDTVVVQGGKLAVESQIDRKSYSVPADVQSTFGTLSDVLSVIPSIDVDPDGVVSLRGNSNVLILIDGKPATQLQGTKAGDNLQSISAKNIERIEVLTTPPAQFKADGAAGVINIITRKGATQESAEGSVQASYGDRNRWLLGAEGSYGTRRLAVDVNAGFREDHRDRTIQSSTIGPDPNTGEVLASQDHELMRIRRNTPSVGFSGKYEPTDYQSLSLTGTWLSRGGLRTYTQLDSTARPPGPISTSTRRVTKGHDPEDDFNTTLGFTQKFSKPGETLDISLHRSISHQHEHYDYVNDSFIPPVATFYNDLSFTEDQGVTQAYIDYALPLSTTSLKFGYAFEQDDYGFDTVGAHLHPVTGQHIIDPALSNDFEVRQQVHALYQSWQGSRAPWTWLAGLRTEWTTRRALQITSAVETSSKYVELYPSLHVDRTVSDTSTLSMGVSRRVQRPDPSYLNPYVDREYPPNLTAGNPGLRPQLTQSYELGYAYEGRNGASYGATGYYRRNKDGMTQVTQYLGGGLSLTTRTNLPSSAAAGLEFSATGHLLPKLSYGLSGDAFYSQFDAAPLGTPRLRSTTGIDLKAKLNYHATALDSGQITISRTDMRLTPQGNVSAMNIVNLGYKHAFTPALSAVATISDVFDGQRYRRMVSAPAFTQVYERIAAGRITYVGVLYRLGIARGQKQPAFDYDSGNDK